MKKTFLFIVCCLLSLNTFAQSTDYYKLTRIIRNGESIGAVEGGQFITFVDNACYESDSEGFSVGNGHLRYSKTQNGIITYVGNSYWGNSVFRFSADKKRLYVIVSPEEIYVYEVSSAPKSVKTSSLIRKNKPKKQAWPGVYPPYTDSYYNNPTVPLGASNEGSSVEKNKGSHNEQIQRIHDFYDNRYGYIDCPSCHGSGICQTCNGKGWYNGFGNTIVCPNCSHNHNGQCGRCQGKGTVYGIKQ